MSSISSWRRPYSSTNRVRVLAGSAGNPRIALPLLVITANVTAISASCDRSARAAYARFGSTRLRSAWDHGPTDFRLGRRQPVDRCGASFLNLSLWRPRERENAQTFRWFARCRSEHLPRVRVWKHPRNSEIWRANAVIGPTRVVLSTGNGAQNSQSIWSGGPSKSKPRICPSIRRSSPFNDACCRRRCSAKGAVTKKSGHSFRGQGASVRHGKIRYRF